jgi:hypothetical protein
MALVVRKKDTRLLLALKSGPCSKLNGTQTVLDVDQRSASDRPDIARNRSLSTTPTPPRALYEKAGRETDAMCAEQAVSVW